MINLNADMNNADVSLDSLPDLLAWGNRKIKDDESGAATWRYIFTFFATVIEKRNTLAFNVITYAVIGYLVCLREVRRNSLSEESDDHP